MKKLKDFIPDADDLKKEVAEILNISDAIISD